MKQRLKQKIEHICARHPRLASLYYAVFSRAMSHEHFTVLNGKRRYSEQGFNTVLRRNTHRIEKGLIMVPRRPNFALDYIDETIDALAQVLSSKRPTNDSMRWSMDVLTRYFDVQQAHPVIEKAQEKFTQLHQQTQTTKIPFSRGQRPSVTFDEFQYLNKYRRSVRWYEQRPVPRDQVDKAIEVARQAPSACNRQPFFMRIYDKPESIEMVANMPGGTKGFSHNFPMIIAMTGQLRNYYSEADRHIIFIDASLFAMNFALALETLGLSSCIINWPENLVTEQQAVDKLGLENDERIIFLISVGYADETKLVPYSEKKSLEELRKYEP